MNSKLQDFFCRSYSLEHTKRYSMVPVIHSESVASHSFFVSLGVLLLRNTYKFDVQKAVLIALCHDLPEMDISDVNHLVKKTYPAVAKALKDAEEQIIQGLPDEVRPYCEMYGDHSIEAMIVHYADAFQCAQYATNELGMGNTGYMEDVLKNSQRRMTELEAKLQPHRIEND